MAVFQRRATKGDTIVRYLTKSRFTLAVECPTKLFYTGKEQRYADQKLSDSFLLALAEGGFQVGELAKYYFPGGHDIRSLDHAGALEETNVLLQQERVVIYEAAVAHNNLFVRVDVLVKNGNHLDLIEVKAKSIEGPNPDQFTTKSGTLVSNWRPYLYDVAFQKHVLCRAFPGCRVSGFLMLADKTACCPTDGLNQKFKITTDSAGRKGVTVSGTLSDADLTPPILCQAPVDDQIELIRNNLDSRPPDPLSFQERIDLWAERYAQDEKISPRPGKKCGQCQFKARPEDEAAGLRSGFKECWQEAFAWSEQDFSEPSVLDIWSCRKKDRFIADGLLKMADVTEEDLTVRSDDKPGLSSSERQWLQVEKVRKNDSTSWLDHEHLQAEMASWTFPLHFIDFETTMAAIPFNKGRRPYEAIAFQYSHHLVHEDSRVVHQGQYLNSERGVFPNYDFVRALRNELSQDQGTIFRYSNHENTFLNHIYRQLQEDQADIPDRDELCAFIRTITKSTGNSVEEWEGRRSMVDLWELVKRHYYDPATNGSNSIKQVLPAILNSSTFLQERYGRPIYGAPEGIPSLNFSNRQWIKMEQGRVVDPYRLLPPLFQEIPQDHPFLLSNDPNLKDGGAAMTAYARMQFEEMSDYERAELHQALLNYCELDTLAMVMIYEGWREMVAEH